MPTKIPPVDILLYVALGEEYSTMRKQGLGAPSLTIEHQNLALTLYFHKVRCTVEKRDYVVLAVPAGSMGPTVAAVITSSLIDEYKPKNVVVIGIAGSIDNEIMPGHVLVPSVVVEYLANAAAKGKKAPWTFTTSGNQFRSAGRLRNRFQQLGNTDPEAYALWRTGTKKAYRRLIKEEVKKSLLKKKMSIPNDCQLFVADDRRLASGPAVGKGKAFADWLKNDVDRKHVAIEMESAGVYASAVERVNALRVLAIRGISDFADERKNKLEDISKGAFRKLAVHNALTLFLTGIEVGLFGNDPTGNDQPRFEKGAPNDPGLRKVKVPKDRIKLQ